MPAPEQYQARGGLSKYLVTEETGSKAAMFRKPDPVVKAACQDSFMVVPSCVSPNQSKETEVTSVWSWGRRVPHSLHPLAWLLVSPAPSPQPPLHSTARATFGNPNPCHYSSASCPLSDSGCPRASFQVSAHTSQTAGTPDPCPALPVLQRTPGRDRRGAPAPAGLPQLGVSPPPAAPAHRRPHTGPQNAAVGSPGAS